MVRNFILLKQGGQSQTYSAAWAAACFCSRARAKPSQELHWADVRAQQVRGCLVALISSKVAISMT